MARLAGQLGYECSADQVRHRVLAMQPSPQYAVLVAEIQRGPIAGWIGLYVFRSVELEAFAEISGLVVDEAIRSRGVGKALLDAAEDWARSVGSAILSVRSNVIRDRAHRFYATNGFRQIKTQNVFCKELR